MRSRDWFIWAALAVLIGSLLGGLLPLVSGIWRRKELLRAELKGVLERYKQVRDNAAAPPIHWHLDDAVGPEPWFRDDWLALPRLQGAGGLYSSIRWARTDAELDELTDWVLDLSARIGRWLRLHQPVRDLGEAFDEPIRARGDKLWRQTGTYRDTRLLLLETQHEPATDEAAEQLLHRVLEQRQWHHEVAELWKAVSAAQADPNIPKARREKIAALDLKPITDPEVAEAKRTPEQQRELIADLEDLKAQLETLKTGEPQPTAEIVEGAAIPSVLLASAARVRDAIATFDQAIAAKINAARGASAASPDNRNPAKIIGGVLWNEKWLTALLALGALLAYVLPLYDSTWGSSTDYLTAIAAGFGTQAIVRWAALPAFESLRIRRRAAQETQTPEATPDGDASGGDGGSNGGDDRSGGNGGETEPPDDKPATAVAQARSGDKGTREPSTEPAAAGD